MGGEVCHAKDKERGPWFQIQCIKDNIISLKSKGKDTTFQRELLKSWSKYPGWEGAKQALEECCNAPPHSCEIKNLGHGELRQYLL